MAKCCKSLVRGAVIVLLAGGTAAVVAESVRPGAVGAIFQQSGQTIARVIDRHIDDPIALRQQIRDLEAEYPEKIAGVRGDLAEVDEQIDRLRRELAVSEQVVRLTAADLATLDDGIDRAEAAGLASPGAIVRIAFDARTLEVGEALARRAQIERTREVYGGRAEEIETELGYLEDQRAQLADLLARLETERADFQAQLFQLDAQIDSIARNERMITMMEQRQKTIDQHSRYEAHSLDQLTGRLERVRAEQRARLASIGKRENEQSYVDQAQRLVDRGLDDGVVIETSPAPTPAERIIKIEAVRPNNARNDEPEASGPVLAGPAVVGP